MSFFYEEATGVVERKAVVGAGSFCFPTKRRKDDGPAWSYESGVFTGDFVGAGHGPDGAICRRSILTAHLLAAVADVEEQGVWLGACGSCWPDGRAQVAGLEEAFWMHFCYREKGASGSGKTRRGKVRSAWWCRRRGVPVGAQLASAQISNTACRKHAGNRKSATQQAVDAHVPPAPRDRGPRL